MYENYYGANPAEEKQKKKIVIVSLIMGIIILVLIGVLINAIVKKNHLKSANTDTTVAVIDESAEAPAARTSEESAEAANLAPVENTDGSATSSSETSSAESTTSTGSEEATTSASSKLPQTGPADLLPLALLLGSVVTFASSRKLAVAKA